MSTLEASAGRRYWLPRSIRVWARRRLVWEGTERIAFKVHRVLARYLEGAHLKQSKGVLFKLAYGLHDGCWMHVCGYSLASSLRIAWIWWKP
jgi:hypothetical protein